MPDCIIQLEKGQKMPVITFSQIRGIEETCKECEEKFTIFLHKSDRGKWLRGDCQSCGNRVILTPKQCELIQPSSNLFEFYYGEDPFKVARKKRKETMIQKENLKGDREDRLKIKVKQGLLKPWELGDVKSYIKEHNLE